MIQRIVAITVKELRQLRRDRMTFGMIVMIPLLQLMLFGFAINTDVRHINAGVADFSGSPTATALIDTIEATQVADINHTYFTLDDANRALTNGEVSAVLVIPENFGERLLQHPAYRGGSANEFTRPVAQWLVDGGDTVVAASLKSLRSMLLNDLSGRLAQPTTPTFELVNYFNPEQRSVVNIVPGLLAIILTMTMILFTSAAIVREREQGNMEFLITTPVRPLELMIGKILPYIIVGLIQAGIILGMGHLIFGVPVRGSLLSLTAVSLLFIFASLTLGLIFSTLAKTQLQAMQMTVFILMPSILLSGFMFPYAAMPEPAQWIAEGLPATHFMRMIRAVVLRGADVTSLSHDALWLAGFSVIGVIIASLRFRKRLD